MQILAYDPTRTTTLRNAFAREMAKRFRKLQLLINEAVVERDCFGLLPVRYAEMFPPYNREFANLRTADKVEGFIEWLQLQENRGVLEMPTLEKVGDSPYAVWTSLYIYESYKRGVQRARSELRAKGYAVPTIEESGGIEAVMVAPYHDDVVRALYTRVFADLKGITSAMDTHISRVLGQGLIDGDHPRVLAKKLLATINGKGVGDLGITDTLGRVIPATRRAEMLARTEVVRAHHMANMQEYESWGTEELQIEAEYITAGDRRVCLECAQYEGRHSLEFVRNLIPVHPMCRCVAIPVEKKK